MKRHLRGFTLIELLIVVAIIAILAAIAAPNFTEAQIRAKTSRAKSDLRTIANALSMYLVDYDDYPYGYTEKSEMGEYNWEKHGFYRDDQNMSNNWELQVLTTPIAYMGSVPPDPFKTGNISELPNDTNYEYLSNRRRYEIMQACGYDGKAPFWWELRSNGPDRVRSAGKSPANYILQVYDPTNGSKSGGDILWIDRGLVNDLSTGRKE